MIIYLSVRKVQPRLIKKTGGMACWLGLVLYFNIVARHIKRFKTAVAMEFARRDCDWFNLIVLLNI